MCDGALACSPHRYHTRTHPLVHPALGAALAPRPGAVALPASPRLTARARRRAVLAANDAFKWMGCAIIFVACVGVAPLYFPMWGGLFCGPKPGVTEEDYYYSEYTPKEREEGLHLAASNFVRPGARAALKPCAKTLYKTLHHKRARRACPWPRPSPCALAPAPR